MPALRPRRGVALLATLALTAAIATVAAFSAANSSDGRRAARNRTDMMRSIWKAEGCTAISVAHLNQSLAAFQTPLALNLVWGSLDSILEKSSLLKDYGCRLTAVASGTSLGINEISEAQLSALIGSSVLPEVRDSMVASFFDWRDADSTARPYGAEIDWYRQHSRALPRNGRFAAVAELHLVRGWESAYPVVASLTLEQRNIVVDRAPRSVVGALEGMPSEAVEWIDRNRTELRGRDLSAVISRLSRAAQEHMQLRYVDLLAATASTPDEWDLRFQFPNADGRGLIVTFVIARAGNRVQVLQRREEFL